MNLIIRARLVSENQTFMRVTADGGLPGQTFPDRLLPREVSTQGPKRCRYSLETMNALTISAFWKSPLN